MTSHEASQLNVAESVGMSQDLPYMAEVLVKRIQRHPKINVEKDWKVCHSLRTRFIYYLYSFYRYSYIFLIRLFRRLFQRLDTDEDTNLLYSLSH